MNLSEKYNMGRGRREANKVGVYITANISESMLDSGFSLGDNETYCRYHNHRLRAGFSYNVRLMFNYDGTDTAIFVDPENQPISEFCFLSD